MNSYDDLEQYCSNTAVITGHSEEISYAELLETADNIGQQLPNRCLVFVVCKNCFESVAGYIGFIRARAALVLIPDAIDNKFFAKLLETYKPGYIYLPKEQPLLLSNVEIVSSHRSYTLHKTNYCIDYSLHDDLAMLVSTSGSTGSRKFVRQSYGNVNSNAGAIGQYLGITSADRPITTLPMSYTYALSIINSHLLKGASIILTEASLMEKRFWEALRDNNATTFGGVPYSFEMLQKLRFEEMDLPSIRYITQAGGKLNLDLTSEFVENCAQKDIEFIVMYGQAEAAPRMSYLPWQHARTKIGSVGIAIPGGKFWLEDECGNEIIDSDATGELVYQGDNVTMGYAESRFDLRKGDENNGILHTGDLASRDADGFYYITGRKKRFLKMYGHRVNLDEIEDLVRAAGHNCACVGTDDKLKIYFTKPGENDRIVSYVSKRTGINTAGFVSVYIGEIPRNESGKVLYSALG